MKKAGFRGFNTRAVQAGEIKDPRFGNVTTPIFQTSTFEAPNTTENAYIDNTTGKPFMYGRWGNPTIQAFEEKYASLEGSGHALAFSSGMGAISATVLSMVGKGEKLLALNELYGQTYTLFARTMRGLGIETDFLTLSEINRAEFDARKYKAVFIESIVNPTMGVADVKRIARVCSEADVPLIVDATFASPYNQRPIELGARVVVHSVTKYIGGHSDLIMGIAGCSGKEFSGTANLRKALGTNPDPIQSYLAMRGLKTLGLRMEKHNSNGMTLSRFLSDHQKIRKVMYPGLETSEFHSIAKENLSGYGGMLAFEVKGGIQAARTLMKNLRIASPAPSLGGVESLITLPVDTSHGGLTPEERMKAGIPDGLVRFSAGIEDAEDLIEDFNLALEKI